MEGERAWRIVAPANEKEEGTKLHTWKQTYPQRQFNNVKPKIHLYGQTEKKNLVAGHENVKNAGKM